MVEPTPKQVEAEWLQTWGSLRVWDRIVRDEEFRTEFGHLKVIDTSRSWPSGYKTTVLLSDGTQATKERGSSVWWVASAPATNMESSAQKQG